MDRQGLLKKVQSYGFAVYDLQLYLDTHPDDKKAFNMFKDLVEKTKEAMAEYQDQYGPLTPHATAMYDTYKWIEGPWPWEKEANK